MKTFEQEIRLENQVIAELLQGNDVIDTWLDDENGDRALITDYVGNHLNAVPINSIPDPEFKYLARELHKIEDIKIVWIAGQPDSLFFKASDEDSLLKLTQQWKQ